MTMHISKPLLLLWAVACIAIHAFGQNAIDGQTINLGEAAASNQTLAAVIDDQTINNRETVGSNQTLAAVINGQTTNDREAASSNQTFATYIAGSITKPSPGQSIYGVKSWQTNGTGWGTSAEYRMKIRGRNYGGILFSDTPTNSTLYVPRQEPFSWPIRRYEFDVLWTHEFAPVRHRVVPYVTSGAGAIALNGGSTGTHSGWDGQAALVGGAGSDVRLSRLITLRAGFTMDSFKASTYSDPAYRSTGTIMVEPRIGLVWGFGLPHPY
jgi:hypothetical protein